MEPTQVQDIRFTQGGSHPATLTEDERKQWQDHEWVLHDPATQQTYAGSVVAVSNQTILGVGLTHRDALQAALACPGCPPRQQIVTVAVEGFPLPVARTPADQEHT